jgi:tetratricopeptide (TPR) repeat protein
VQLSNLGIARDRQIVLLQKAYDLRDRLSDTERYNTIGYYWYRGPNPDDMKAIAAFESLVELDSADFAGANNLAVLYNAHREFDKAERLWRGANRVDPTISTPYNNLVGLFLRQGRVAEADSVISAMARNLPRSPQPAVHRRSLAAATGDYGRAIEISDSLKKARPNDAVILTGTAATLGQIFRTRGQLAQALVHSAEAGARTAAAGNPQARLNTALDEPDFDAWYRTDKAQALKGIEAALAANPLDKILAVQRPYTRLAVLYARAGRPDVAKTLLQQRESSGNAISIDREQREGERHQVLAEIAIAEKRYDDAVREARASGWGACVTCSGALVGRAFDLAGSADSAIAHMSRYADSPDRVLGVDQTWLAGSHKRLGELYEAKGDAAKAAEHYRKFINLWDKADPELQPQVAAARAKLAKLQPTEKTKP